MNFHEEPKRACPACGVETTISTMVDGGPDEAISEGDISLCSKCGHIATLENGKLVSTPFEVLRDLSPDEQQKIMVGQLMIRALRAEKNIGAAYEEQCQKMYERGKAWRAAHPTEAAVVQFNWPSGVALIVPVSVAWEKGLLTANDAGKRLVAAICEGDTGAKEPTVMMLRLTMEHEPKSRDKEGWQTQARKRFE